jgi:pimeloyl-ACP methyl ester carboxylesterase
MKPSHWLGETIRIGDVNLYYEVHGLGKPLVCLHNFTANSRSRFAALLPMLATQYKCYLVDLRGHGRSDNPTNNWTHEQFSRDIIGLCKAIDVHDAYFLAASSGAMTMLRVARYAPELVRAMVLDSGTYRVPPEAERYYKHPDTLSESLKSYYRHTNEIYGPEYGRVLAEAFYSFRLPDCDVNISLEALTSITAPTLLVAGDRDVFFPVDIHIDMKQTIPNSELAIYPRTQHIAMQYHPEEVAAMALKFFGKV